MISEDWEVLLVSASSTRIVYTPSMARLIPVVRIQGSHHRNLPAGKLLLTRTAHTPCPDMGGMGGILRRMRRRSEPLPVY